MEKDETPGYRLKAGARLRVVNSCIFTKITAGDRYYVILVQILDVNVINVNPL